MADVQLMPGELVGTATHELLNGTPDWSANMQLADLVNQREDNAGTVMRALSKRLPHKNHGVGLTAIILLESLVKNAPKNILPFLSSDEFLTSLVKVLPKSVRDPHNKSIFSSLKPDYTRDIQACERYDKILLCIESWAHTFGENNPRYRVFSDTYRNLQRAGVRFPKQERDELAPIATPPVSAELQKKKEEEKRKNREELERAERERQQQSKPQQPSLNFKDADCRSAVETATLFTEMLNQTSEGENLKSNEIVQEVWSSMKPLAGVVQKRLQELAMKPNPSEQQQQTLAELFQANDICVDAALYFEGLVNGTTKRRAPVVEQPAPAAAPVSSSSSSVSASTPPRKKSVEKKEKEKKAVPLLQPPPGSSEGGSRRKSSTAESPAKASAAPAAPASSSKSSSSTDLDFLFSPAQATPPQVVMQPPVSQLQQQPSQQADFFGFNAPAASPPMMQQQPHQVPYQPAFPSLQYQQQQPFYPQQQQQPVDPFQNLAGGNMNMNMHQAQPPMYMQQQQQQYQQQPHRPNYSAFALAPPPAAANSGFFSSPSNFGSQPHQQSPQQQQPQQQQRAAPAPTPFDDDDPFAALARRSTPNAKSSSSVDKQFANLQF